MNKSSSCQAWLMIGALSLTSGCSSLKNGGAPDPAFSLNTDLAALQASLQTTASVTAYHSGTKNEAARNAFIDARLALTNLAYIQFISDLTADKQEIDTAADMLVLGLTLFGTTATGVRAKANLAASAAGIAGTKTSIDKNYFQEKTTSTLIAMMNARRKEVLVRIIEGTRKPLAEYSFTQALSDVYDYYTAGTLNAALISIQSDAAARDTQAEEELKNVGELEALTDAQAADREAAITRILDVLNEGDLALVQEALTLLGQQALPQANLAEARNSLTVSFRTALRDSPDLAKTIKDQL